MIMDLNKPRVLNFGVQLIQTWVIPQIMQLIKSEIIRVMILPGG